MTLVELFLATKNFKADSMIMVLGPSGNYEPFNIYEEDGIVFIDVVPRGDNYVPEVRK